MSKSIGVLGCGWLGLPLAKKLLELNYEVSGTTTSKEKLDQLQSEGIKPFQIILSEKGIQGDISGFLSKIDTLIVNVPPALRSNPNSNYVKKMELLKNMIQQHDVQYLLFVSSTSVYGDQEGEITEETPPKPTTASGKQLLASENLFFDQKRLSTSIIRFGGLIGPNRHPVYHLADKTGLQNGDDLINLIHLDDCINMITKIIENGYWQEVFNGVFPHHPTKAAYYTEEALKRDLNPPKYSTSDKKNRKKKVVNKNFLIKNFVLYTSIVS